MKPAAFESNSNRYSFKNPMSSGPLTKIRQEKFKIIKTKYRKRNRGTLSLVNFSGRNSIRGFFDQNSDKNYGKIFVKILEGFSEKMEKILQIHSNK